MPPVSWKRTKKLAGGVIATSLLLLGLTTLLPASSAVAATPAFFPGAPTAIQVSRQVSLAEAAQAGAAKLGAKGGFSGDDVSLELEGKEFKGPITVALKVEFTLPKGKTPEEQKQLTEVVPFEREQTEAELNRLPNKTSKGDPVKFKLEWKVADPNDPPTPNYQHVTVVDPLKDLRRARQRLPLGDRRARDAERRRQRNRRQIHRLGHGQAGDDGPRDAPLDGRRRPLRRRLPLQRPRLSAARRRGWRRRR